MKIPRDLSGSDLIRVRCRNFGYVKLGQEGSHVILHTETPRPHRLSVPNHPFLRVGTLHGILKAVARVKEISPDDILRAL